MGTRRTFLTYAGLAALDTIITSGKQGVASSLDPGGRQPRRREGPNVDSDETSRQLKARLAPIADVVESSIVAGDCPGAVVLIGHDGRVIYRRAFGHRALLPRKLPMTTGTIFDLASLTKVIATTPAIMQLVEQGKIRLDDPVVKYWPEFGANGKEEITVCELMTHYSGFPPDLPLTPGWSGYKTAMELIIQEKLVAPPGTRWIYSDINFETLGELVRRLSDQTLDVYAAAHIFGPLRMKNTCFNPLTRHPGWRKRIAPTEYQFGTRGKMLWGKVNDPTAYDMGGVAGHAGLFSTADDLAVYANMILNYGSYGKARVLSPLSVLKMTTPQSPPGRLIVRGLGWDIDSPYSSARGNFFPVGSFGHTGFTGTSLWIDPVSKTYVIVLTSRLYPNGKGDVIDMRSEIASIAAAALGEHSVGSIVKSRCPLTGNSELGRSYRVRGARNGKVLTGIDVLQRRNFAPLVGLRVGLITNQTGVDGEGRRTIDLLHRAPGVRLIALFSPEHGLEGKANGRVNSSADAKTGLPIYSLYGEVRHPTEKMLHGLDALVFDIQDVGVRFYTYITTLGYCMQAAAKQGIGFYVLDRPNPITGFLVEGPLPDKDLRSFVSFFPLPIRHGMTVGELAEMFNREYHIGARLEIIKMDGWERTDWYDETGLQWINPSPNLRSLAETTLYPGVAMVEGANVSVGRGTDTPFEVLGAPWIDSKRLSEHLNSRDIQGVRFLPLDFTPRTDRFAGETCHGVQIFLLDRESLGPPEMGVEIAAALTHLFPVHFELDKTLDLIGARWVLEAVKQGKDPLRIAFLWQTRLNHFRMMRAKYLLY